MDKNFMIGLRIWQVANNQGFTKTAFAEKVGVSRQTLDNWIKGKDRPNYENLQKVSVILGVQFTAAGVLEVVKKPDHTTKDEVSMLQRQLLNCRARVIELMEENTALLQLVEEKLKLKPS